MPDLPIMLRVAGRLCVVIGGGEVAARRVGSLLDAGATVRVIAPQIAAEIDATKADVQRRPYRRGDLAGALLAVIATDDPATNAAAAEEAASLNILVNRADDAALGDAAIPAHAHHGPVTLAVHTGGVSARAAAAIRRELSAALDPAWPQLLELAAPFRTIIQQRFADDATRRERLAQLAGADAQQILKHHGPAALTSFYQSLVAAK